MLSSRYKKRLALALLVLSTAAYVVHRQVEAFTRMYRDLDSGGGGGQDTPSQSCGRGAPALRALSPENELPMIATRNTTGHRMPMGAELSNVQQRCREKEYSLSSLPTAAVIITFFSGEEAQWIIHTVHSIVQNSPPQLLREVVLVDDASITEDHKEMLANYMRNMFGPLVKIVRHPGPKPLGVIQARLLGIRSSSADVVVVTDAHMEAAPRWLEPLLQAIHDDRRILANFYLDGIKYKNGVWYERVTSHKTTAFYWEGFGFLMWEHDSPAERQRRQEDPTRPVKSASSVGHWAMERAFFEEIGALDEGMALWGGENIDLAIRTYLWGGTVYNIPCSHVAHVEKSGTRDYRYEGDVPSTIRSNFVRIAEVWFDDLKPVFYHYNKDYDKLDPRNLTERLELKKRCPGTIHDFLERGYPQLGWSTRSSIVRGGAACAAMPGFVFYSMEAWRCGMRRPGHVNPHEDVYISSDGHLRLQLNSFDVEDGKKKLKHNYYFNEFAQRSQWLHKKGGVLQALGTNQCLVCVPDEKLYGVRACDPADPAQQWTFGEYTELYTRLETGVDVSDKLASSYAQAYRQHLSGS